jgi:hypothetical protein
MYTIYIYIYIYTTAHPHAVERGGRTEGTGKIFNSGKGREDEGNGGNIQQPFSRRYE